MGRANWLLDVLSDAFRGLGGFRVDYVPGWESRGYSSLYPKGVINHHTGRGSYNGLLNYMSEGSSISPLCNVATSRPDSGIVRVTVVASGKANHAGRGYLPWTGQDRGNNYSIGFENQNDGAQQWPQQQNEAIAIANKAVLDHLGVGVSRLADHKTYAPNRKVDRVHIDLDHWKNYVANIENNISLGGNQMVVSKGAKGKLVERIQKDVNVLLTWHAHGPSKMSLQPVDGVGIAVDGDYGPATAEGIREVMQKCEGIDVSGDSFGGPESYVFLRWGYFVDDDRHNKVTGDHGGSSTDTSKLATKDELSNVDAKVNKLRTNFDDHRHSEGVTGKPRV